jgi:hypothetical protein
MERKRFEGIDYGFRPISYWKVTDPLAALLRNVKGTNRRQMIRDYWNAGRINKLSEDLLEVALCDDQRALLGTFHPSFMGGEYLPEYRHGEVEIARIELRSVTSDVMSVRARPRKSGILYSVCDERTAAPSSLKIVPQP